MSTWTCSRALGRAIGGALFVAPLVARAQTPTPFELITRHEAALGGRDALNKHSTVRLTGTVSADSGAATGTIEIIRSKDNKFVQKMTIKGVGELSKGFDGKVAWSIERSEPALLTDVDSAALRSHSQWDHDYLAPVALFVGRVDSADFEEQPTWEVTFASDLGLESHTFFSRESGLRLGTIVNMSDGVTTTVYGDYTDVSGVKIPARVVTRSDESEMVITITKIEFDKVDGKAFNVPPAIKTILKQE